MDSDGKELTEDRMINPSIFVHLQAKIDEDSSVREELRNLVQNLEKQGIQQ